MPIALDQLIPDDPPATRRAYGALALVCALCFWLTTQVYFVPVTRGGDRNGYLLGGRMLAEGHSFISPTDPFLFYGPHWVMFSPERLVLKYPLGLPLIYAVVYRLVGRADLLAAAHQISPAAMTLAVWGTFLFLRPLVGSFRAWLGMIVLASSPITLFFANLPNSHAAAICAAVWGMLLLIKWWREAQTWCAIAAGLVIGFDFTIRYTEGLLLLPMLLVIYFAAASVRRSISPSPGTPAFGSEAQARRGEGRGEGPERTPTAATKQENAPHPSPLPANRERGQEFRSVMAGGGMILAAWLLPVFILLAHNWLTFGHLTGYALTHESTAFTFNSLIGHARGMASQIWSNVLGIFLIPVVLGGILMFKSNWRMALVIWSWVLPTLLLYSSYYWMPTDEPGLSYARFVLTVLPGLVLAGLWFPRNLTNISTAVLGLIVFATVAMSVPAANDRAAGLQFEDIGSQTLLDAVRAKIPTGSVIFTEQPNIVPLQIAGDWRIYLHNLFTRQYINTLSTAANQGPGIMQAERASQLLKLMGDGSDAYLMTQQYTLMESAIENHKHIYIVLPEAAATRFVRRLNPSAWQIQILDQWTIDTRWRDPASDVPPVKMLLAEIRGR